MQNQSKNWPGVQYPLNIGPASTHYGLMNIRSVTESFLKVFIFSYDDFVYLYYLFISLCLFVDMGKMIQIP